MEVRILRPILYEIAKKRAESKPREYSVDVFHASELGGCPRAIYFKRMGLDKVEPRPVNYFRLEDGTALHLRIQKDLQEAKVLIEKEKIVKEKLLGIQGHFDGVVNVEIAIGVQEPVLLEIKSINKKGFTELYKPKKGHYIQANFYAIRKKLKKILFYYYCIDNGDTKEYLEDISLTVYADTVSMIQRTKKYLLDKVTPIETIPEDCFFCPYAWFCRMDKEVTKKCLVL